MAWIVTQIILLQRNQIVDGMDRNSEHRYIVNRSLSNRLPLSEHLIANISDHSFTTEYSSAEDTGWKYITTSLLNQRFSSTFSEATVLSVIVLDQLTLPPIIKAWCMVVPVVGPYLPLHRRCRNTKQGRSRVYCWVHRMHNV